MTYTIGFEGSAWWIEGPKLSDLPRWKILLENEYLTTPPIKGFLRIMAIDNATDQGDPTRIEYINKDAITRMFQAS